MTVGITADTSENRVDAVSESFEESLPALTQSEPAALVVADNLEDGESCAMHSTLDDNGGSCAAHSTLQSVDDNGGSRAAHSTLQSVLESVSEDGESCATHSTKEEASCAVHSMRDDKTLGFNHGLGEDWISVSTDREYLLQRIVWIKEGLRNGDETWGSASWSIPQLERRVAELTIEGDSGASAIQRLKIGEKLAAAVGVEPFNPTGLGSSDDEESPVEAADGAGGLLAAPSESSRICTLGRSRKAEEEMVVGRITVVDSPAGEASMSLPIPILPRDVSMSERVGQQGGRKITFAETLSTPPGTTDVPGPTAREVSSSVQLLFANPSGHVYGTLGGRRYESGGLIGLSSEEGESPCDTGLRVYRELIVAHKGIRQAVHRALSTGAMKSCSYIDAVGFRHTSTTYLVALGDAAAHALQIQPGEQPRLERLYTGEFRALEMPTTRWFSSAEQLARLIARDQFRSAEARAMSSMTVAVSKDEGWAPANGTPPTGPLWNPAAKRLAKQISTVGKVEVKGKAEATYSPRHIERLLKVATERAIRNGSRCISARDVTEAAAQIRRYERDGPRPKPVDPSPVHEEELSSLLSELKTWVTELVRKTGCRRPLVLVAFEASAIVARAFRDAGCDVVTCDLVPSEDRTIPHFEGDLSHIQDLGFDLVITHPPCKYLTNAGVTWLDEPGRLQRMEDAARLFVRAFAARAPFVAQENPRMHARARAAIGGLKADMVVHPWEHGHNDTKAANFFTRGGLPEVKPTCVIEGRTHRLTQLPQTEYRSEDRARSYIGVAAGMALSWVPAVMRHVLVNHPPSTGSQKLKKNRRSWESAMTKTIGDRSLWELDAATRAVSSMAREAMDYSAVPVTPRMMVTRAECSLKTTTFAASRESDSRAVKDTHGDKITMVCGEPTNGSSTLRFVRGRPDEPDLGPLSPAKPPIPHDRLGHCVGVGKDQEGIYAIPFHYPSRPDWKERSVDEIERGLMSVESRVLRRPCLCGEGFTYPVGNVIPKGADASLHPRCRRESCEREVAGFMAREQQSIAWMSAPAGVVRSSPAPLVNTMHNVDDEEESEGKDEVEEEGAGGELTSPIRRLRLAKGKWLVWAPTRACFTDPMYRWTPLGVTVAAKLRQHLREMYGQLNGIPEAAQDVSCLTMESSGIYVCREGVEEAAHMEAASSSDERVGMSPLSDKLSAIGDVYAEKVESRDGTFREPLTALPGEPCPGCGKVREGQGKLQCTRGLGAKRCCAPKKERKGPGEGPYGEREPRKYRVRQTAEQRVPYTGHTLQLYAEGKMVMDASGSYLATGPDIRPETERSWFRDGMDLQAPQGWPRGVAYGKVQSQKLAAELRGRAYPSSRREGEESESDGNISPSHDAPRKVASVSVSSVRRTLKFAEGATLTRLHRREEGRVQAEPDTKVASRAVVLVLAHGDRVLVSRAGDGTVTLPTAKWRLSEVEAASALMRASASMFEAPTSVHRKVLDAESKPSAFQVGESVTYYHACHLTREEASSMRLAESLLEAQCEEDQTNLLFLPSCSVFDQLYQTDLAEHGEEKRKARLAAWGQALDSSRPECKLGAASAACVLRDWCRSSGEKEVRQVGDLVAVTCSGAAYPTRAIPIEMELPTRASERALPCVQNEWSKVVGSPVKRPSAVRGLSDRHAAVLTDGRGVFIHDSTLPSSPVLPSDQGGEQVARRALKEALQVYAGREGCAELAEVLTASRFDYSFTRMGTRYHVALIPTLSSFPGLDLSSLGRNGDDEKLATLHKQIDVLALDRLSLIFDREARVRTKAPQSSEQAISLIEGANPDDQVLVGGIEESQSVRKPDSDLLTQNALDSWAEDDVDDTPALLSSTCAYMRDVVVCQGSKNGKDRGKQYRVHAAACKVPGMADTGAFTSVITDGMIQTLPPDAVLEWEARPPRCMTDSDARGVGGVRLVILGYAIIVFYLGGKLFRHRFMVVEGDPIFILGNDFLGKCKAKVVSSTDEGSGAVQLYHQKTESWVTVGLMPNPEPSAPRLRPRVGLVNRPAETEPDTDYTDVSDAEVEKPCASEAAAGEASTETVPTDAPRSKSPLEQLVSKEHLLFASRPFKVPGRTERTLRVRLPKALAESTEDLMISPLPDRVGLEGTKLRIAYSITRADKGHAFIKAVNPLRKDIYTAELTPLGRVEVDHYVLRERQPTDSPTSAWDALTELEREQLLKATVDEKAGLSEEQRQAAYELLARRVGAFAMDPNKPNRTHLLEVEIDLIPGARPHRHAPSRHGPEGHRITDAAVGEMLANGTIRRGTGPWASRTVLVAKKTGEARFCVDLRDLNSKMVVQDTPLPRCDDSIERLAGAPWDEHSPGKPPTGRKFKMFHTLDLAAGFWCLPIKEEHKERTGFVTERGKFEWNFLPFGLCSGPSYMQRLIEAALQGLSYEICMPYLDDVAIWASGATQKDCFEQAMERLDWVLQRFEWAGLSAKPKKCTFFAESCEYLGHLIGPDGVAVHPDKAEAVSRIKATDINSLESVRSFLGLLGYFRKFIQGFPVISAPLTALTKSGVDVPKQSQTPECQEAVEILKLALATAPVLAAPVPPTVERPFELHTDGASLKGIGACLMQPDEEGSFKPLGYFGRRLIDAETRYTVTEIELLAIVKSIKHFRHLLWGQRFTIVTDHAALRWLETLKDNVGGGLSGRLTRWAIHLMEYRYDVRYKPGKTHYVPDALSRLVSVVQSRIASSEELARRPIVVAAVRTGESNDSERELPVVRDSARCISAVRQACDEGFVQAAIGEGMDGAIGFYGRAAAELVAAFRADRRREAAKPQAKGSTELPAKLMETLSGTRDAINRSHSGEGLPSQDSLRDLQYADLECAEVLATLIVGEPPQLPPTPEGAIEPSCQVRAARRKKLMDHAKLCVIRDGLLCRREFKGTTNRVDRRGSTEVAPRVWIPKSLREAYLTAFHDAAGHQSRDRAYALIGRSVYWPGLHSDMVDHVQRCHECTFSKRLPRRQGRAHMPEVGEYPFSLCVCDIVDMTESKDGYTKCIIFADSLSRWIEAIPLKKDPTSAEVLDIFLRHIVCRYGCPLVVRSDCGSNLTSKLVQEVYDVCKVRLARSTAYHHSSAGVVERFNNTLVEMTKATDQGGKDWADHLPFLCFCYNATPHRVTRESPANILYGRELRLPAEMHLLGDAKVKNWESLREYSKTQVELLRGAWEAALRATQVAQARDAEATDSRRALDTFFEVGDRVLLHTEVLQNKLEWNWSGPYRVEEILEKDVYRLRDLPNKRIVDRVSVDRLRHYLTVTDALPLGVDEYLVQELIGRRVVAGNREYRVKFKGYAKSASEWLPEDNLLGRCSDMVRAYEASHPVTPGTDPAAAAPTSRAGRAAYHRGRAAERTSARRADAVDESDEVPTGANSENEEDDQPPVVQPPLSEAGVAPEPYPLGSIPSQAKFERGVWMYRIEVTPRRARPGADKQVRWMPEHHFSTEEKLDFAPLREAHTQSVGGMMLGALLPMCEMDRPSRPTVTEVGPPPTTEKQKAYYRDAEGHYEAAKIVLISAETGRLYCGLRRGSSQVDFVGGHRSWADLSQVETARREVKEELAPGPARAAVLEAILRAPHSSAIAVNIGGSHRVIYYAVHLPDRVLSRLELSSEGERELSSWAARVPSAFRDSRADEMWKEVKAAVFSVVAVSTERAARRRLNEKISRCAVRTASQGP